VSEAHIHTVAVMGTVVTLHVVGHGRDPAVRLERKDGVERAVAWFHHIDESCTRFDERSELRQLCTQIGTSVPVSALLFEAIQFALAVAAETDGAFDPTVGIQMEALGFNREFRSGKIVRTGLERRADVSYRDVRLDPVRQAITLLRPMVLDLGAVAKGLAVDMAARELRPFVNFAVDAGGDLYLGGHNADQRPWSVGIRHPRREHELIDTLRVSDAAVCTSGDYERRSPSAGAGYDLLVGGTGHHILDPRSGLPTAGVASVTVVAPSAMVADALSTAAMALGPVAGLALLERHGVDGMIVTPALDRFETRGMRDRRNVRRGPATAARDA
jgi:thiamine biosynthesis lipoprotein